MLAFSATWFCLEQKQSHNEAAKCTHFRPVVIYTLGGARSVIHIDPLPIFSWSLRLVEGKFLFGSHFCWFKIKHCKQWSVAYKLSSSTGKWTESADKCDIVKHWEQLSKLQNYERYTVQQRDLMNSSASLPRLLSKTWLWVQLLLVLIKKYSIFNI